MDDYIYIITPLTAWVVAQVIKFLLILRKDGIQISDFIASGGMPSAHTAGVIALTTVVGSRVGIESPLFGICLTLAGVVMYDSLGVRRATGQNTMAIQLLSNKLHTGSRISTLLAKGHTPLQVLAGAILGIVIGVILTRTL